MSVINLMVHIYSANTLKIDDFQYSSFKRKPFLQCGSHEMLMDSSVEPTYFFILCVGLNIIIHITGFVKSTRAQKS